MPRSRRLVGRDSQVAVFDELLVDDPPASVVLVHGPGGIGKSTLLREVARRAGRRGFTTTLVEGAGAGAGAARACGAGGSRSGASGRRAATTHG